MACIEDIDPLDDVNSDDDSCDYDSSSTVTTQDLIVDDNSDCSTVDNLNQDSFVDLILSSERYRNRSTSEQNNKFLHHNNNVNCDEVEEFVV